MGRRTIVLVIAVVLAGVSGFAIWTYLSSIEDDIRADINEVRVYRSTETIETGTSGTDAKPFIEEGLALRETVVFEDSTVLCLGPAEHNEGGDPNQVGCPENPRDLDAILDGSVAAGPITAHQVITTDQWISPTEIADISLSESLEQGKVAIAFRPDEVSAVGGFIRPGDRINMMASASVPLNQFLTIVSDPELRALVLGDAFDTGIIVTAPDDEGDPIAQLAGTLPGSMNFVQTFMQDVHVLAVGPDVDVPGGRIPTGLTPQGAQIIVLQVTPQQAELIQFAKEYSTISTMLLPADVPYTPFDSVGVIIDDLFTLVDRIQAQLEDTLGGTGN